MNTTYWKVELTVSTTTNGVTTNGTNSIILKRNQVPYNGMCSLQNSTGYALQTMFVINCTKWIDADGFIISYKFYGNLFI